MKGFTIIQCSVSQKNEPKTGQSTKGRESFFSACRGVLFLNISLASIVHYNLLEVEEHDLAELSHSMYSLLEPEA